MGDRAWRLDFKRRHQRHAKWRGSHRDRNDAARIPTPFRNLKERGGRGGVLITSTRGRRRHVREEGRGGWKGAGVTRNHAPTHILLQSTSVSVHVLIAVNLTVSRSSDDKGESGRGVGGVWTPEASVPPQLARRREVTHVKRKRGGPQERTAVIADESISARLQSFPLFLADKSAE